MNDKDYHMIHRKSISPLAERGLKPENMSAVGVAGVAGGRTVKTDTDVARFSLEGVEGDITRTLGLRAKDRRKSAIAFILVSGTKEWRKTAIAFVFEMGTGSVVTRTSATGGDGGAVTDADGGAVTDADGDGGVSKRAEVTNGFATVVVKGFANGFAEAEAKAAARKPSMVVIRSPRGFCIIPPSNGAAGT